MAKGLLGKKIGMTQIFAEDGTVIPVTVVEAGPCPILQVKTVETDGYEAIQVGFDEYAVKPHKPTRPVKGVFDKASTAPRRVIREFRVPSASEYSVGSELDVSVFSEGVQIDVTGVSKGHGFAGAMKRHGFAGHRASHGAHKVHRKVGSIGMAAWPSKVLKGKRMPGHFGNVRRTVKNLKIVKIVEGQNLLLIKGAVPGPNGGYLIIQQRSN